ncbi:nitrogen permease regulator 2 [Dipodascopsis tothii]|uniref:nitrogen permease regulator 2 n=1 Tax=Dipodascopsis tothii TaxID=44089 RepID=UPI0034CD8D47
MTDFGGFPQILSLFYATFHPTEGTKVLHQIPAGSIGDGPDALFSLDAIGSYVIPKPQLCNKLLTLRVGQHRLISHPVHIRDASYARNSFMFNFGFVFAKHTEVSAYLPVVRKLSKMFRELEEQSRYLSAGDPGALQAVVDQVFEDLNNYCECFIPIDNNNTVNIKLFPLHPPPRQIKAFHVPVSTVHLPTVMDVNWDPTMEKIVQYIDGVNSVRRIADLADTNFDLTRKCIQHLMYYGCVIIVDVFKFNNVYACTPAVADLAADAAMAAECRAYVARPGADAPPAPELLALYCAMHTAQTVAGWYTAHRARLAGVDVRRFVSFGVIKGLLYRVRDYPLLGPAHGPAADDAAARVARAARGSRHLDDLCTTLQVGREQALRALRAHGDLAVVRA